MQLIDHNGENQGVISRRDALQKAREAGLDLVLLAADGPLGHPLCKIIDYGKELYNRKKKQHDAKKHQKVVEVKEVKIRPKIGEHDYQTKMNQAIGFLDDGNKVKFTLVFRKGREVTNKDERGQELFEKIRKTLEEAGYLSRLVEEKDMKVSTAWTKIFSLKKA